MTMGTGVRTAYYRQDFTHLDPVTLRPDSPQLGRLQHLDVRCVCHESGLLRIMVHFSACSLARCWAHSAQVPNTDRWPTSVE